MTTTTTTTTQTTTAVAASEEICEGDGSGLLLPLFGRDENNWDKSFRTVLYLVGLLYCFMGVAIIADVFMAAIEKVTSKKTRRWNKQRRQYVTTEVWNPTVANLTLMALGSSAPEILLNVIFIFADGFFQEGLGPSTIVGSAAFNLLVISAVCVVCIPAGEVRRIKDMPVYIVTASFSIFAYVWLIVILMVLSPNVVEVWEGVITFLFFPVLVGLAFGADKGLFSPGGAPADSRHRISSAMSKEELATLEAKIRQEHGAGITDEQVLKLIEAEHQAPRSRAQYRVDATRAMTGGRRVETSKAVNPLYNVTPAATCDDPLATQAPCAIVEFESAQYVCLESIKSISLTVKRRGELKSMAAVKFSTRDGSATAVSDYITTQGRLVFKPKEVLMVIEVPIVDDKSFEQNEDFFVDLIPDDEFSDGCLGDIVTAKVTIVDDDEPGNIRFLKATETVQEASENVEVKVGVERYGGGSGEIGCKFTTEDDSALAGYDYVATSGDLVFPPGQMTAWISVTIKAKGRYESSEQFRIVLHDPTGGAKFDEETDGGADSCIMYLSIESDDKAKERIDKLMGNLRVNWDKASLGRDNWSAQIKDAIYVNGADGEGTPGVTDYILHFLNLPWKLLCALVPPPDFADGWACFCSSLAVIGGVTAVIGDMAGLLGCCMFGPGNDGITAITFVALGTSLPDTFASMAAAQQDPYADASIGNITGSNSVNVFLGLGLPWMIAAIYWQVAGPGGADSKWNTLYRDKSFTSSFVGEARLIVEDPGLGRSVTVFTICALFCMGILLARRVLCGGELGGPFGPKYGSAAIFVCLWFVFVGSYVLMS